MALSEKAMLVYLSQSIWSAAASDRTIAMRAEKAHDADGHSMRVVKNLAPPEYLLPIKRLAHYGRDQHEKLTVPGLVKGQQLLSTKVFDQYAETQAMIKDDFFKEVKKFAEECYPEIVRFAPVRLGKAYRETDFPEAEKITSYFDYRLRFSPVPDSNNWFLSELEGSQMDELRNEVENQKNELFREATKELYTRAKGVLENLMQQATHYEEGQTRGGMLREVTINSVKEMAYLLSGMNVTEDPVLTAVSKEMMQAFGNVEAKELRQSAEARKDIASLASSILEKMKGK